MKEIQKELSQIFLCVLFALVWMPLRAESSHKLFSTLIPEPLKVKIIHEDNVWLPQSTIGFYLDKKAKIPFGQKYFPNTQEAAPGKILYFSELIEPSSTRKGINCRSEMVNLLLRHLRKLVYYMECKL